MRVLAVALSLLAAWPIQALAQPQAAEGAPAPAQTAEIDPQAVAAATDLYRAIAIDSGGIDLLVNAAFAIHGPRIRQSVLTSPLYGDLSSEHQTSLLAFLDTLPALVREESAAALESATNHVAPRLAVLMSPAHMTESAAFLRGPHMREPWKALMSQVVTSDGASEGGAFPDLAGTPEGRAFAATPAGIALVSQQEAIDTIFSDASEMAFMQLESRLQARAAEGMCAAMEEECPAALRSAAEFLNRRQ